jgi:preprotein translocase subunit SecG
METALLFVHLLTALGLVGLVLMQRSEGGALGIGGGGGLMTGRGAADVLARATTVLAAIFFLTSLSLTLLAQADRKQKSVIETAPVTAPVKPAAPATAPVRAAPLENYTLPVEGGGLVAPAPGEGAERAAPLPLAPATGAAPAAPALRATTTPAADPAKPAQPAPKLAAPAATRPAASPVPAESVQTIPSAPAPSQPRTRAGPDE